MERTEKEEDCKKERRGEKEVRRCFRGIKRKKKREGTEKEDCRKKKERRMREDEKELRGFTRLR